MKNHAYRPISRFISEMIQDRAIVTIRVFYRESIFGVQKITRGVCQVVGCGVGAPLPAKGSGV